jgi:plasmid stability protein
MKGRHLSEEEKENLRSLYKGKTWEDRYGSERAQQLRQKLSTATMGQQVHLGMKHSSATKQKMRLARLGKSASDETREKMRQNMLGTKRALGHRCSVESKKKMSLAQLGKGLGNKYALGSRRTEAQKELLSKKLLSLHLKRSDETKEKIRSKLSGSLHWNWKGGKTKLSLALRACTKYKNWRTSVFERDHYQCQNCGQIGGDLEADHIIPFSELIELTGVKTLEDALHVLLLWDLTNGRTLCHKCHKETDTWGHKLQKNKKTRNSIMRLQ